MSAFSMKWLSALENNHSKLPLHVEEVFEHPLQKIDHDLTKIVNSQANTEGSSPASKTFPVTFEGFDPLTQLAKEADNNELETSMEMDENAKINENRKYSLKMEPWSSRKTGILSKYTTSEKLPLVTSFFNEGEKVIVKSRNTSLDRLQYRLEQLDYIEEGYQRKLELTQVEYIDRIDKLNKELVSAWYSDHRVKALKIVIQCAKLLADVEVIQFYPSKFVLITEILDSFGNLVFERLRFKATNTTNKSVNISNLPDVIPESAKETCRNWFYKISSIRELIPRLYVEMAILKSYSFLTSSEISSALSRLTKMIRGIGNPLVASYIKCYLCRVGLTVSSLINADSSYLKDNFNDFIQCYSELSSFFASEEIKKQGVTASNYYTLYTPALQFILQAIVCTSSNDFSVDVLKKCRVIGNSGFLLNTVIASSESSFVSMRADEVLELIKQCVKQEFPIYIILCNFGRAVNACPPPSELRKKILRDVWNIISQLGDPEQYINCAEIWIQYVVQYFMSKELNLILGNIAENMLRRRISENFYPQLKNIISGILSFTSDFETLLIMENFLPLVDLFQNEKAKSEVCKIILNGYIIENHQTNDPVVTNSLLFLCSILHDSISALTVDDEKRQIAEILCQVIKKVNYGSDFEQQLTFYVEARAAFSKVDLVLAKLVQCVNTLAVNVKLILKGARTKKTSAFLKACAAYCFTTVPSIQSSETRLNLYLLSGKVALFTNCLGQADAFFATTITCLSELNIKKIDIQRSSDSFVVSFVKNFLSLLVVVPDSPDRGVLSLTKALLNVLKNMNFEKAQTLPLIYIHVLDLLSTVVQENYPYHVETVESNDLFYGSDPKFTQEVEKMSCIIVKEIVNEMNAIGSCPQQSLLALELFNRIVLKSEIVDDTISNFVQELWSIGLNFQSDNNVKRLMCSTKQHLEYHSKISSRIALKKLLTNLKI